MAIQIERVTAELEKELIDFSFGDSPSELYDPIRYLLSNGGKRLRPLLTVLGCYLFDEDYQKSLKPAIATEVFHNFTLMHDDLMDNAPLRRSKPTVHEKWNANIAILSGDVMLVKAYDLLLSIEPALLPEAIRLFNKCAAGVCEGQQWDMNFEDKEKVSVDEYLNMIRLKTAVLLGFSLELGALIGGATKEQAHQLQQAGVDIGLGFQLRDDLLDVYGDQNKFGKQVGGDIIANKKTYLLIRALEKSGNAQLAELENWLKAKPVDPTEKVQGVTDLYNQTGVKEDTEALIGNYFEKGLEIFEEMPTNEERKKPLLDLVRKLMHRDK